MDTNGTVVNYTLIYTPDTHEGSKIGVHAFGFMLLLSIAVNLYVIWFAVFPLSKNRGQRTINLLVANLAFTCALTCFSVMFNTGTAASIFHIEGYSCQIASYVKHVSICSFATGAASIIIERIRIFREHTDGQCNAATYILISWFLSLTVNIPVVFTVNSTTIQIGDEQIGYCEKVLLLNSITLTIIYEINIFILFHCILVGIIIYAIISIQSKVDYLLLITPVPSDSLRRKIRSIRILCYYLVTFVFVWLPVGLIKLHGRIKSRLSSTDTSTYPSNRSTLFWIVSLISVAYFSITPFISLAVVSTEFSKNLSYRVASFRLRMSRLRNILDWLVINEVELQRSSQHGESDTSVVTRVEEFQMDDFSRVSTVQPSGAGPSRDVIIAYRPELQGTCVFYQTTEETWV